MTVAACALAACDGQGPDPLAALPEAVRLAAYGGERLPAGFAAGESSDEGRVWYVGRNQEEGFRLLCADSAEDARDFLRRPGGRVSPPHRDATPEHYEFPFEDSRARVYRCEAVEEVVFGRVVLGSRPDGTPLSLSGPTRVGPFGPALRDADAARAALDRVWFHRNWNMGGTFVLSREAVDEADAVVYGLHEGRIMPSDPVCDEVETFRTEFRVDKATGQVAIARSDFRAYPGACRRPTELQR